jgi:hypothetical protein
MLTYFSRKVDKLRMAHQRFSVRGASMDDERRLAAVMRG